MMAEPPAGPWANLRALALDLPEATEEFPWGERVAKVRGKIFVFLGRQGVGEGAAGQGEEGGSLCVKLRQSHGPALLMPFVTPAGYNLGKHGWVVARFEPGDAIPEAMLGGWIRESYRLVAPKRLAAAIVDPARLLPQ